MIKTKRGRKQDRKLVSAKQGWEIKYMYDTYGAPAAVVRKVIEEVGHDRDDIAARLIELGYKKKIYKPKKIKS